MSLRRRVRRQSLVLLVALFAVAAGIPACGTDDEPSASNSAAAGDASGAAGEGASGGSTSGGASGHGGDATGGRVPDNGGAGQAGEPGGAGDGNTGSGGSAGGDRGGTGGTSSAGSGGRGSSGTAGESAAGGEGGGAGAGGEGGGDTGPCANDARRTCGVEPGVRGGCFTKVQFCTNSAWGPCVTAPGEIPSGGGEACNGEDDDCDGEADEDLGSFTCGIGACALTVPACVAGAVTACIPRAPTAATDGCNGVDDDCDGAIDEDCPACTKVAPNGDDAAAAANSGTTPFQNVQTAIDFANTHRTISTRVCVASGAACGATASYAGPSSGPLTMRDGISVIGRYESTTWTPCPTSVTTLAPRTSEGVLFPANVRSTTVLHGFTIERFSSAVTSGVTVDGGRGALLSNLTIANEPVAATLYGVNVVNGGDATVFRGWIDGGTTATTVVGVRSVGARVSVLDNCPGLLDATTGRCNASCGGEFGSQGPSPAIRARPVTDDSAAYAVLLEDSPGSRVERSLICLAAGGEIGRSSEEYSAIRVTGAGNGVLVRANSVQASWQGLDEDGQYNGIRFESCGGAKPWVVDNESIGVWSSRQDAYGKAVGASGDCHPVVDSNAHMTAGSTNYGRSALVTCDAVGGVASRCTVSKNRDMRTQSLPFPGETGPYEVSIGIRCADGSCAKVSRNTILGPDSANCSLCTLETYGMQLERSGPLIDRNTIDLTCVNYGAGIRAWYSWARIQNSVVIPIDWKGCSFGRLPPDTVGLSVLVDDAGNELDVHSNYIQGAGSTLLDVPQAAIELVSRAPGQSPQGTPFHAGVFRDNILITHTNHAGYAFKERGVNHDPRVLQHNFLDTGSLLNGFPLYRDEGMSDLFSAAAVNGLTDTIASGNADSSSGRYCSLTPGTASPCVNSGTADGAPLWDFDGLPRDAQPDIGPKELR